jgi:hypothetical protein
MRIAGTLVVVRPILQYHPNLGRLEASFHGLASNILLAVVSIDAIIYYASHVFQSIGLTGGTAALLATGIVGCVIFMSILPAMLIIDKVGRKPLLLVGSTVIWSSMISRASLLPTSAMGLQ